MSKVYTLCTVIQTKTGGTQVIPMKHFDDEKVATGAKDMMKSEFMALLQDAKIVVPGDRGPVVLMPLAQFLGQLGIAGVGHEVGAGELHGAVVLEPRASQIILPGRN